VNQEEMILPAAAAKQAASSKIVLGYCSNKEKKRREN